MRDTVVALCGGSGDDAPSSVAGSALADACSSNSATIGKAADSVLIAIVNLLSASVHNVVAMEPVFGALRVCSASWSQDSRSGKHSPSNSLPSGPATV
jgi:hypothetical protein